MAASPGTQAARSRRRAARALLVDRVSAEVVSSLRERGLRVILMKGPVFGSLLYEEGEARGYTDTDLLVAPGDLEAAGVELARLGFEPMADSPLPRHYHHVWRRHRDAALVELHWTIWGAEAHPEEVWQALSAKTARARVAGQEVEVPSPEASALHIALHAVQHGRELAKTHDDLERALARFDEGRWRRAAELARRLGAGPAFAAGLRMAPEGHALAGRLGLSGERSREVALAAWNASPTARYLSQLATTAGLRARAVAIGRVLFPTPRFMANEPLALRHGAPGLIVAYPWRLVRGVAALPSALATLRRATSKKGDGASIAIRDRLDGPTLRAAWWALRAVRRASHTYTREGLVPVQLPAVPKVGPGGERGVLGVLRRTRASCLVRAMVLQAWEAAHGHRRDLVIGITAPSAGFEAHAWLDGDEPPAQLAFRELLRRPAP